MTIISGWRFQGISVVSERISEWWQYVVQRISVRLRGRLVFPVNMKKTEWQLMVLMYQMNLCFVCTKQFYSFLFIHVYRCTSLSACLLTFLSWKYLCVVMHVRRCIQAGVWTYVCVCGWVFLQYACSEWKGVCLLILLTALVTAPPCTVRSDVK